MLTAPETLRLKAAQRRAVQLAGGQEACVLIPGMRLTRHQAFNEFGHPAQPERHMPLDVLATVERVTGPVVTSVLASLSRHLLVPLPEGLGTGPIAVGTGRSAKEFGELMTRIGGALTDNRIDAAEGRAILTEIHELMVELAGLAEAVKATAGKGDDDGN